MALVPKDLKYVWHPCSQMKDFETFPPIHIHSAHGPYLYTEQGKLIDAISSWWCKTLGHQHPRLKNALVKQADYYEHVILANTCQKPAVDLAENLMSIISGYDKIFYANDGSTAVEIALKLSLHSRHIMQQPHKTKIVRLANAYHGETILCLSISDLNLYRHAYNPWLIEAMTLNEIPYVQNRYESNWLSCEESFVNTEVFLRKNAANITALILEPIVQGAAGMKIYSADFLSRLRKLTSELDIHLIVDEIMTGFYRTGPILAQQHAACQADMVCLGKGLTAGYLPLSAVLISNSITELFYNDYELEKNFLHSNTFAGNALACSIANEALSIYQEINIEQKVAILESKLHSKFCELNTPKSFLNNIRAIGGLVAGDLNLEYFAHLPRPGQTVFKKAMSYGALLRPLGNTIYWYPPLNIEADVIDELQEITYKSLYEASKH